MALADAARAAFLRDVVIGLSREPRSIPCKYFYDAPGSALFEQITDLPEYYPTRTEIGILEDNGDSMAAAIGPRAVLVEFGSGSSRKTRVLLDALTEPAAYVPIDISEEHLLAAAADLRKDYPRLDVLPLPADYSSEYDLPTLPPHRRVVAFFPGSTIGNFERDTAIRFLRRIADLIGPDGGLLIGVDLEKEAGILERAYNDAQGVTAAFNTNLLHRINAELEGTIDVSQFAHRAVWNPNMGRIEMYLVATAAQEITVGGHRFAFEAGEMIHTENSHKYTLDGFATLAASAGLEREHCWIDEDRLFSVQYLVHAT